MVFDPLKKQCNNLHLEGVSMKNVILISLASFFLLQSACSVVSFNRRRQVTYKKEWYGTQFYQGENRLDKADMAADFRQRPKLEKYMSKYEPRRTISMALGLVGGFSFGWAAGGGFDDQGLMLGGLAMVAGAFFLELQADKYMIKAVDYHNKFANNSPLNNSSYAKLSPPTGFMLPLLNYKF